MDINNSVTTIMRVSLSATNLYVFQSIENFYSFNHPVFLQPKNNRAATTRQPYSSFYILNPYY